MVRRRFIYCGVAAAFILNGVARAEEPADLRTTLGAPDPVTAAGAQQPGPEGLVMASARPTTLEVAPLVEPPPPPRQRRREDDPYAALGLDVGGLTVFPVLRAGVVVSDNPASLPSDREGDFGARLRPTLRVTSDWVRHELTVEGSGDFILYADRSDNDSNDADIRADLRLDVLRSTSLLLEAGYSLSQENGSDSEVPDTAIGNRTDQSFNQKAALTHRFGRLTGTLSAGADWRYYGDVDLAGGGKEDNGDREYVEPDASFRVGYEVSPAFRPFIEAGYAPRIHFESQDRNGFDRDSDGYRLSMGFAFEPSPLWSGELALTYLLRDYADPDLETVDTFGATGQVTWRPGEMTTVDLTLSTALNETATAGSSGSRLHGGQLRVAHDLREYLTVTGSAGVDYEDFQGTDQTELTLRSNAGILWRMNRWLAWTLDYDFIYNDSSEPQSDDYENRITAGVELRG